MSLAYYRIMSVQVLDPEVTIKHGIRKEIKLEKAADKNRNKNKYRDYRVISV